jgi:nucleoside-diphosphate-sugar epimerase
MDRRFFCFGLGYSASHLAGILLGEGCRVAGSVRRPERQAALAPLGVRAARFDEDHDLPDDALAGVTDLLISIPPEAGGDPVLARCAAALAGAAPSLRWIGYLSTTGVYGDHGGGWVDENTALRPSSERARHRVGAEQAWLGFGAAHGVKTQIFRLAGIYGPGRSVLDEIRAGTAKCIVKPGHWFSRIHVGDIAQVVRAAMLGRSSATIFNVCDDEPAASADVLRFACALLAVDPPPEIPFAQAELSPMALSFWADNKRVRNQRLKEELGIRLMFPTYREGLTALTSSSAAP